MKEVFNRYEFKYLIDKKTYTDIIKEIHPYVIKDEFGDDNGFYTINNIYYDTEDCLFHEETMNNQQFRQKLRLRTYNESQIDGKAYLEIKKKLNGVVIKRRTAMKLKDAYSLLERDNKDKHIITEVSNRQILKEIEFLASFYNLVPNKVLCYERQAFQGVKESDLRITFDKNLRKRNYDFRLETGSHGELFMPQDIYVFEVKVDNRIPFWLARILSKFECFKQSFSKYSTSQIESSLAETS